MAASIEVMASLAPLAAVKVMSAAAIWAAVAPAAGVVPPVIFRPVAVPATEAFVANGITLDDVEDWRFRRLGQIKKLMDGAEIGPDLRWKA